MESTIPNTTFCPDEIFKRLDTYITQVQILDNIQVSNPRKILSRTLGLISLSEKVGQKKIEITKDGLTLYCAKKARDWTIVENQLNREQISVIENLPQTKEQIFLEFYSRKLTHKLKEIFQLKNYPIDRAISLNHAQVPYEFLISHESTTNKIIFVGTNLENDIVFKSSFYKNAQVQVITNNLSLEHINQLCCFNS
ncbi:hypothetical protein I4641_02440 [Waterburya agarophytonicola K14]|uniref:Uncharacterized protein n=1 Tax=Waterburya agarophytonicola KI4 TaxID=2874699 RepID=A0A964FDP8_9CYAN|nr:hypothetical protein [Waterburya agarophytonicola]MCC0175840.1 hypothetical protein [Waterburya agarophytonicola KI4]